MTEQKQNAIKVVTQNSGDREGVATGNNAAWLCECSYPLPLIGRSDNTPVICIDCGRQYSVCAESNLKKVTRVEEVTTTMKFAATEKKITNTHIVGKIGLFYVCYELSRRGFSVIPASGKTNNVKVSDGNSSCSVKVTTAHFGRSNSPDIGLRSKIETKADALKVASAVDFWVNVLLDTDGTVLNAFIWEGDNEKLIDCTKTNWLFKTNRQNDVDKEIWKPYKNELGWQLITDHINGK